MTTTFAQSLVDTILWGLVGAAAVMVIAGSIALIKRDNGTVDVFWGPMIASAATFGTVGTGTDVTWVSIMALSVAWIWALRLAIHIGLRKRGAKGEDFRYAQWRKDWGKWWLVRSIGQVFFLQASLAVIVSSPLLVIAASSEPVGWRWMLAIVGIAVWAVGFALEVAADQQITRFISRKKSGTETARLCTTGVWSVSRHPNYLGEAILWWGIGIMSVSVPYGWIGLIGPIVITYLLRFVSGVPLLEAAWRDREGFAEWAKHTPVFLPRPIGRVR